MIDSLLLDEVRGMRQELRALTIEIRGEKNYPGIKGRVAKLQRQMKIVFWVGSVIVSALLGGKVHFPPAAAGGASVTAQTSAAVSPAAATQPEGE